MEKTKAATKTAQGSVLERWIFTALAIAALAIAVTTIATPAFAGDMAEPRLPAPGILSLAAAGVVAVIYLVRRKR